jgi:hypothetical protein
MRLLYKKKQSTSRDYFFLLVCFIFPFNEFRLNLVWEVRSVTENASVRITYNNRHFDVKLAPEFFDGKLIICITFPDKPEEGSKQVIGFKIWPRIGYIDAPHDTEIKQRICEIAYNESCLYQQ